MGIMVSEVSYQGEVAGLVPGWHFVHANHSDAEPNNKFIIPLSQ